MFLKKYLPKIEISEYDKREYSSYLNSKGIFKAVEIFFSHLWYLLVNYAKLSKQEKERSYIYIYYDPADYPILSINYW